MNKLNCSCLWKSLWLVWGRKRGLFCRTAFTITNRTAAMYCLNEFFSFCAALTRNLPYDNCFCFFLRISWKCDIAFLSNIHWSHCYNRIQVLLCKTLHCFPHFTHLPNLICNERFLCLFLLCWQSFPP